MLGKVSEVDLCLTSQVPAAPELWPRSGEIEALLRGALAGCDWNGFLLGG